MLVVFRVRIIVLSLQYVIDDGAKLGKISIASKYFGEYFPNKVTFC
jgi:hypothetical protein